MSLIIDGHNLIQAVPGISLSDVDDEMQLVGLLQEYCRLKRKTIEVYFDKAAPGEAGERRFGQVKAVFVRSGVTADDAIMARLRRLGKRAKNVKVVSSDRQVQQAARAAHAQVISSSEFGAEIASLSGEAPGLDPRSRLLSPEEVADWEQLFRYGHPPGGKKK